MITAVTSAKGAPGTTSTALALAACWPRPVVLVEADPSGGDLAYRCVGLGGGPIRADRGLLSLAADVRAGRSQPHTVASHSVQLRNGVALVQGIAGVRQARGVAGCWSNVVDAFARSEVDVIVDAGRVATDNGAAELLRSSSLILAVATATAESVTHLLSALPEIAAVAPDDARVRLILVGQASRAERDCADVDDLIRDRGLDATTMHVSHDPPALLRLEQGDDPGGRLSRTPLVRSTRRLVAGLLAAPEEGQASGSVAHSGASTLRPSSPDGPATGASKATASAADPRPGSRWWAPRAGEAS